MDVAGSLARSLFQSVGDPLHTSLLDQNVVIISNGTEWCRFAKRSRIQTPKAQR